MSGMEPTDEIDSSCSAEPKKKVPKLETTVYGVEAQSPSNAPTNEANILPCDGGNVPSQPETLTIIPQSPQPTQTVIDYEPYAQYMYDGSNNQQQPYSPNSGPIIIGAYVDHQSHQLSELMQENAMLKCSLQRLTAHEGKIAQYADFIRTLLIRECKRQKNAVRCRCTQGNFKQLLGQLTATNQLLQTVNNKLRKLQNQKPPVNRPADEKEQYNVQLELLRCDRAVLVKTKTEQSMKVQQLLEESIADEYDMWRIKLENRSRFGNYPLLSGRFLLMGLAGTDRFSYRYKAFDLERLAYVSCKIHPFRMALDACQYTEVLERLHDWYRIQLTHVHEVFLKTEYVFSVDRTALYVVQEPYEMCTLDRYLKAHISTAEKFVRPMIVQLVSALQYLARADPNMIHGNLAPCNIILMAGDISGRIKITNFYRTMVSSELLDESLTQPTVYNPYFPSLPPECYDSCRIQVPSKIDVWSIGLIFYRCLYGALPYTLTADGLSIFSEVDTYNNPPPLTFPDGVRVSPGVRKFLNDTLAVRMEDRLDIITLAAHDYLKPPRVLKMPPSSSAPTEETNNDLHGSLLYDPNQRTITGNDATGIDIDFESITDPSPPATDDAVED